MRRRAARLVGLTGLTSLTGLMGLAAGAAGAALAQPAATLSLRAVQHSDALPLARFGTDDFAASLAPRGTRNLAYLDHEARLSRSFARGELALIARQSATLTLSRGAVELTADAETSGRPDGDRRWDVQARYLAFAGTGLAASRTLPLAGGWTLRVGAQALALHHWRERRIHGSAAYRQALQTYSADLRSFHAGDRLTFPYAQAFARRGQAVLLDGELRWAAPRFAAALGWRDAGRLRWRGLPQEAARLSTDTQAQDADGFLIYRPLVQGQNSQAGRSRSAPLRWTASVVADAVPGLQLSLAAEHVPDFGLLPFAGAAWQRGDWRWGARWHAHERRAVAQLAWRGLSLQLGADRFGPHARSRELSINAAWPL